MPENQTFNEKIKDKWDEGKFVCIGLDSDILKIPGFLRQPKVLSGIHPVLDFNKQIIQATKLLVCAYKINTAIYERSAWDTKAMEQTIDIIRDADPAIPIIGDMKRGDIENTNKYLAEMAYERFGFDAITVSPYFGFDVLAPFLKYKDKGLFLLCKTSNPDSGLLQDLPVNVGWADCLSSPEKEKLCGLIFNTHAPLYQVMAFLVSERLSSLNQVGLVVGAADNQALAKIRQVAPGLPLLIPGVGKQGGDLEKVIKYAPDKNGLGFIISSSRSIIYAGYDKYFAKATREQTLQISDNIAKLISYGIY